MANTSTREVVRSAIIQKDAAGTVHHLLVQRPEDSKREPNKLSLIGGTVNPDIEVNPDEDYYAAQAAWHIKNELGIDANPQDLVLVDRLVTIEDQTFIQWQEVCYMLQLKGESFPTFSDHQPHHGVPRPIEWFAVNHQEGEGLIFSADKTSEQPLRPINGRSSEEGFTRDEIAFKQYLFILIATINASAAEDDDDVQEVE
jgi:hypothetical protein